MQERCTALEENINGKFPTVRWKLFDRQINGGIIDTCVCMIPCESGLVSYECANTAAQVNADIEIVNVLSKACRSLWTILSASTSLRTPIRSSSPFPFPTINN